MITAVKSYYSWCFWPDRNDILNSTVKLVQGAVVKHGKLFLAGLTQHYELTSKQED